MSVVLRCPSCGTTQDTPGACHACHETGVRYFCTNHTPGVWLDASTCPSCGARFGDPARSTSKPAAAAPSRTRSETPRREPASLPSEPYSSYRPRTPSGSWEGRERPPRAAIEERERRPSPMSMVHKLLLEAATRARHMSPSAAPVRERRATSRGLGGCLLRVVLMMIFLFVALAVAAFLFGQAMLGTS